MRLTRRGMLMGAGATALGTGALPLLAQRPQTFDLRSRRTSFAFGDAETQGVVSMADHAPPPVLRLRQSEPVVLNYTNGLEDYSTLHWHGIRLPNQMDGVPYMTQFPIAQGETFQYAFTPPDAGTYWYHPHCRTMEQLAQGLSGMLIVEERRDPGFDADIALNLKDFRLDEGGQFLPHFTPRGAARGGTLGNVKTTNWQIAPRYDVPTGGLIRVRLALTDTTRILRLPLADVPGRVIAWDGHPVAAPVPWPSVSAPLTLGPGQRVDVALRAPDAEGAEITLNGLIGGNTFPVAHLRAAGASLNRRLEDTPTLPENPFDLPDLTDAERHELTFGWSPDGDGVRNGLCGDSEFTFWSINRTPWAGYVAPGLQPLIEMRLGKSYVLRLRNESPNVHPIHVHGLVFVPLRSNQRDIPANFTDTLLLRKNEVVDIALRADNLGDWAVHCHVIEHQKTGLSGFIRVT